MRLFWLKPTDMSGMGARLRIDKLTESERENKGAVQEPTILKRHIMESHDLFRILKEKKLTSKVGFKDLGAGCMCATVEYCWRRLWRRNRS